MKNREGIDAQEINELIERLKDNSTVKITEEMEIMYRNSMEEAQKKDFDYEIFKEYLQYRNLNEDFDKFKEQWFKLNNL